MQLDPIPFALVPVDSSAADALGAPNYDEFQSDQEVWELLQVRPRSVLRITMPHCDVTTVDAIEDEHAAATLEKAGRNLMELRRSSLVREVRNVLWVYEITSPRMPNVRQIGLGGMARTDEIRTSENPSGKLIRNEGIREEKAKGRAELTAATKADMGTVNNAVDDGDGTFQRLLIAYADSHAVSFETLDEVGDRHRVWLVTDATEIAPLRAALAREPRAYVADGNHRSAAAAMLGYSHYLAVFFPGSTMTIAPYNRLVVGDLAARPAVLDAIRTRFEVDLAPVDGPYQPEETHMIGWFDGERWWRLRPRAGTYDPKDGAQDIDADIVQRNLFAAVLGIADARDKRLTFVGANRDAAWLEAQVKAGRFAYAMTLPPVTMKQFVTVCIQNKLMPPKSTWFVPKIRSGLVMALL